MSGKYFLIGPYPPPLGGVSIYIYRYSKFLEKQGEEVEFIDFDKMGRLEKFEFLMRYCLISPQKHTFHLNEFNTLTMIALLLRPFQCRIILQNHSIRILDTFRNMKKIMTKLFIKKVDYCVLVGEHLKDGYRKNNIQLPKRVVVKSPFIPPPLEDEEYILSTYSEEVISFLNNHEQILIGNASKITFYKNIDLYGIDMCIEVIRILKNKYPKIGLIFALAEIGDEEYFKSILEKIKEYKIEGNILFLTGQKELWPLFKKSDIMIRPTYSDAYGISIEEAIYFNCRAIASNVCNRPEGTILFENRNINDLVCNIERCIEDMDFKEKSL
ncbi:MULTISPECIES: glycosyltransferase family 4 protein [Bacillus cereus group]|uniref:Glycosyl transferase n=2 Tax=Bacillus TaxID=1386 RepID=A0A9X6FBG8_BACTU|nr:MULTISPECIES: glycosyltransferase family 4 protein [Bacillus cereus group]KMN75005.1 glycosyl transferase [Bacillus cereus]MDA2183227.1 glycosyltransferase family 4 protein [Bacillus cereus]OTY62682.1 glycosyl transferase [Bacillus thuringiensis serovar yosoo]PFO55047.1 glycosyl transferase [Bacillus cereus]QDD86575.1 putative glycosyltransferase [Bacillus cereus]